MQLTVIVTEKVSFKTHLWAAEFFVLPSFQSCFRVFAYCARAHVPKTSAPHNFWGTLQLGIWFNRKRGKTGQAPISTPTLETNKQTSFFQNPSLCSREFSVLPSSQSCFRVFASCARAHGPKASAPHDLWKQEDSISQASLYTHYDSKKMMMMWLRLLKLSISSNSVQHFGIIRTTNSSIYNIKHRFVGSLGKMNRRPSVQCSEYFFFQNSLQKLF